MTHQKPPLTLLVDAGNTRVKIGWLWHGTGQREPQAPGADHQSLPDLITATRRALSAWAPQPGTATVPQIAGAAPQHELPCDALGVSSAGDAVMKQLDDLVQRQFGTHIQWQHSHRRAAGMLSQYAPPEQLGADRWAAMLGMMRHLGHRPLILASFGTATTVDTLFTCGASEHNTPAQAIEPAGPHLGPEGTPAHAIFAGGLILPGPQLMLQALASGTARLPMAQANASAFPTHTHQAIFSGMLAAQAGAVLRQWHHARERFGMPPQVFCTGGGWNMVREELEGALYRAQTQAGLEQESIGELTNPVLDGLAYLAQMNSGALE